MDRKLGNQFRWLETQGKQPSQDPGRIDGCNKCELLRICRRDITWLCYSLCTKRMGSWMRTKSTETVNRKDDWQFFRIKGEMSQITNSHTVCKSPNKSEKRKKKSKLQASKGKLQVLQSPEEMAKCIEEESNSAIKNGVQIVIRVLGQQKSNFSVSTKEHWTLSAESIKTVLWVSIMVIEMLFVHTTSEG